MSAIAAQDSQPKTFRERVERLEEAIALFLPRGDYRIANYFAPGLYAREMTIPAGAFATGAVHKTEHLSVLSAGRVIVITEDAELVITAPYTFVAKAGTKRAVFALETTVWTTFHPTNETDLDQLCRDLTEFDPSELADGPNDVRAKVKARLELVKTEVIS